MTHKVLMVLVCVIFVSTVIAQAQQAESRTGVLVLYWYNKDYPWNMRFDQRFQEALHSAPGGIEYYAEYLESNRFPGDYQSNLLRDYLRQKYVDRNIGVLIATSDASLEFLRKYRSELFPRIPIVFISTRHPTMEELRAPPGLTGVINIRTYAQTLDLALKLHPKTQQLFVISGTLERDKRFETIAREELRGYEDKLEINYLTDVGPEALKATTDSLPNGSLVLYVWQQSENARGKIIESTDILGMIAAGCAVPIYGMTAPYVGGGVVGGYINTADGIAGRSAEMAMRIVNGEAAQDVAVENAPTVPTFDWRQLRRWGISESALPRDSVVLFREPTFWELYKWRILGVGALLLLQTSLIVGLLVERTRRSRATRGLSESEERYRNVVQTQTELICRYLPDTTLTFVNDAYCRYFGKSKTELIGTRFLDLIPEHARHQTQSHLKSLLENPTTEVNENEVILPDGTIAWQQWVNHAIISGDGRVRELQGIGRDITERKLAERALQVSEQRFAKAFNANPQPMSLTTLSEGSYIDINESFLQMSGFSRDEVIGNTSLELRIFQQPEDREKLVGPLRQNGSVRNVELKFRRKDGEFRILLSSAELLHLGGQQCVLVASSDITDRKRLEMERLHAQNELSQLTSRLFSVQDEERRRIARELHDGTAQNLFAISLDIDQIRRQTSKTNSELHSLLDESTSLCDQSLQEIRTLSYLLHPPLLDQAGLVSALKWYVEGFSKRTGIDVNLVALDGVGRLGAEIETALFRIVQEGLTNIRRHSGSETASIRLCRRPSLILLEIQDSGRGMNLNQCLGATDDLDGLGVGIPGMRQRVRQLGGELDITTNGSGTVVTAVIPLSAVPGNGTNPS